MRYHSYGDSGVLVYEEADRPVAGAGQVVVTVAGTAFNPVDIAIRAGFMQQVFPSAESLSDNELLTKLRIPGVDADRAGLERLCENALSAEEVARPMLEKLGLGDDVASDWVWICLLAAQFGATVRVFRSFGRIRRARNSFESPSSNSPGPAGDDIDDAIAVATQAREAAMTILDQNVLSRW